MTAPAQTSRSVEVDLHGSTYDVDRDGRIYKLTDHGRRRVTDPGIEDAVRWEVAFKLAGDELRFGGREPTEREWLWALLLTLAALLGLAWGEAWLWPWCGSTIAWAAGYVAGIAFPVGRAS